MPGVVVILACVKIGKRLTIGVDHVKGRRPKPTPNPDLAVQAAWSPRLIYGEHPSCACVVVILSCVKVGKGLTIGVDHLEAARQALDGPGRWEAAVGHWL